ncbi:MAG TPA: cache domain-containing protein [Candidatus Omnitrophota bacterium]|nr:cache domain-containing protein [Candidatus Omnitrophota bacterium]
MAKLKYKFVSMLFLTSTLPLFLVGGITMLFLSRMAVVSSQTRINTNLKIAHNQYQSVKENLKFITRDQNRRVATLVSEDQLDLLRNEYVKVIKRLNLDFFIVTDKVGTVILSMSSPKFEGYNYSRDLFVRKALRGDVAVAADILSEYELAKYGLMEKARVPTVNPIQGLIIRATIPLINTNENIIGTLTTGYLLNNNNPVVLDKITQGTEFVASLFLDDIRVCSNVPGMSAHPVLGSKLDAQASQAVLKQGDQYLGSVTVAKQKYLAAYTPIYNIQDKIIGILGIGIPEKIIFAQRDKLLVIFLLAIILSILLSLIFGLRKGNIIVRSIRKLRSGIDAFGRGDLNHRIEIRSGDEIEDLANYFNQTMLQLQMTRKELEVCARNVVNLRDKVMESSVQLEEAHKQLVEYERMAAMGRMATVINHELRNVFSEIQASITILKTRAVDEYPQSMPSLKEIEHGLNYASEVLGSVLRLSYPKRLTLMEVDMSVLIEDLLAFAAMRELFLENEVEVRKHVPASLPQIKADGMQIREVLAILVTNAVQAMSDNSSSSGKKNELTIKVDQDHDWMKIEVSDTGKGMPANVLENLFTPFFTTKSRGLGLGLCISREIIKAHKGSIEVLSEVGKGSTFVIKLPL